jgi:hypothetical protein
LNLPGWVSALSHQLGNQVMLVVSAKPMTLAVCRVLKNYYFN